MSFLSYYNILKMGMVIPLSETLPSSLINFVWHNLLYHYVNDFATTFSRQISTNFYSTLLIFILSAGTELFETITSDIFAMFSEDISLSVLIVTVAFPSAI